MPETAAWIQRVRAGVAMLCPRDIAFTLRACPFCGVTVILRLRRDELGVRCLRCGASAVHLSMGWALRSHVRSLGDLDTCELSARGPLVRHLRRRARNVALSEYLPGQSRGSVQDGIRCEDVQQLTYADKSFDLITHTEVFEHVPDDRRAFAELHRVLRPGGVMIFKVPLRRDAATVERALQRDGKVVNLCAPTYHSDPLRAGTGILVYRDYGDDIVERLQTTGFARAWIEAPTRSVPWDYGRAVVCAVRA